MSLLAPVGGCVWCNQVKVDTALKIAIVVPQKSDHRTAGKYGAPGTCRPDYWIERLLQEWEFIALY